MARFAWVTLLGLSGLSAVLADAGPANVTCTDNASDQGNYTSSTGAVFKILCGVDYAGGDLSATNTDTFADCIETCANTTTCVDVSYAGNACYLKSQLETAVSRDWVWTAQIVDTASSGSAGTGGTGSQLTCDNKESDQANYTTPTGLTFQVLCGIDYAGGDLVATSSDTFEGCIDACANTTGCIDVSYVNPSCYMKSQLGTPDVRDYVWTAKQVVASAPAPPPTLSCDNNASDGQTYQVGNDSFLITCGKDYAGGDLLGLSAATFENCIAACDAHTECVNVAYVGGSCYLKQTQEPAVNNAAVWGAVRQQGSGTTTTTATSTASPSTAPTSTPLTCDNGADNLTLYTSAKNAQYQILCGVDYGGGDLVGTTADTFEDCIAACDDNAECIDVSYVAPSCYLKKAVGEPSQVGYVWTAKQLVAPGAGTTSSSTTTPTTTTPPDNDPSTTTPPDSDPSTTTPPDSDASTTTSSDSDSSTATSSDSDASTTTPPDNNSSTTASSDSDPSTTAPLDNASTSASTSTTTTTTTTSSSTTTPTATPSNTFTIVSAVYGTVDITSYALRNWLINNNTTLSIDTNALAAGLAYPASPSDPLAGYQKAVSVLYYTPGGELRSWVGVDSQGVVVFQPGVDVDEAPYSSAVPAEWPAPDGTASAIGIVEVVYGLAQVRDESAWDRLYSDAAVGGSTPAENDIFTDSWYGTRKALVVWYRYLSDGAQGAVYVATAAERDDVTLPAPGSSSARARRVRAMRGRRGVGTW